LVRDVFCVEAREGKERRRWREKERLSIQLCMREMKLEREVEEEGRIADLPRAGGNP